MGGGADGKDDLDFSSMIEPLELLEPRVGGGTRVNERSDEADFSSMTVVGS